MFNSSLFKSPGNPHQHTIFFICDKEASLFKDLFNAQNLLVGFSLFNNVQAFVFSHRFKILLSSNFSICSSRNIISVCSGVRGGVE